MIFLVSSLAKVSIERLSIMILPWLAVSLLVLFLVTYLPNDVVLALREPARLGPPLVVVAVPSPGALAPVAAADARVPRPRPPGSGAVDSAAPP